MTLLAEQLIRVRDIIQSTDSSPMALSKIIVAHQEAMQHLALKDAFPLIQWVNAIAGQSIYLLPTQVVTISHVLYDQRVLRYATEPSLDRRFHGWEDLDGEPLYWTTDNQAPNTIRVIPPPKRTGSTIPVVPPSPLFQDMIDNFVVFHTEDPSADISDQSDVLPTLFDWDDLLVYHTARMMAEKELPEQNLPVAVLCRKLEALWEQYMHYR